MLQRKRKIEVVGRLRTRNCRQWKLLLSWDSFWPSSALALFHSSDFLLPRWGFFLFTFFFLFPLKIRVGMAGAVGFGRRSLPNVNFETSCGGLLRELELIWTEIGDTEAEKDRMLLELEKECMQVYRRKVDEASNARTQLHQTLAAKEAELAALRASLGENTPQSQTSKRESLKERLALITPQLEELRLEKQEREKLFVEIKSQIDKINGEITGYNNSKEFVGLDKKEELDFSLRKINEYQAQLRTLQKEKSDRLHKVLEYVNEVHCLCGVLGMSFGKTLYEVHPTLHEADTGQSTNISNSTLDGLSQAIMKLKIEKNARTRKLKDTLASLYELWNLMNSSEEERRRFEKVTFISESSADDIKDRDILSQETFEQVAAEVERLTKLKAGRLKELVFNRRLELEDICMWTHIEPDKSTAPEKITAMIDSGIMDASHLLDSIDTCILNAQEESISRKDIVDRVGKWLAACEEEKWLEDYNQDSNRYSAGRGAHLNFKRAEKARITVTKISGMVDNLMNRTSAWEDERKKPFMYDGVRLISILEDYKLSRHRKEEENKRYLDQKKSQDTIFMGKEATYRSKPTVRRSSSLNRKPSGIHGSGNGLIPAAPRRASAGSATPDLFTPKPYAGHQNGFFTTDPINHVGTKEKSPSSFASISGSEPGSPPLH